MSRQHISKSTINISANPSEIWKVLITPEIAGSYFFGAEIITDWKEGSSITFRGEFNGNKYEEKGIIRKVVPNIQLQYSHWSNFDGLPDAPENYRIWDFQIEPLNGSSVLIVSEDNIPTEKQKNRSDEFWKDVLRKIKVIAEDV